MFVSCMVVVFMVRFAAIVFSMHTATWLLLEGRERAAATNPLATAKLCRHTGMVVSTKSLLLDGEERAAVILPLATAKLCGDT